MLSDLSNCIPRELTATINDVNLTTKLECTATNTIIDKQVLINRAVNNGHAWPQNTVLIAGDSILNGIEENRLKKNHSVKVRSFPGSNIDDMYDYLKTIIEKETIVYYFTCWIQRRSFQDVIANSRRDEKFNSTY